MSRSLKQTTLFERTSCGTWARFHARGSKLSLSSPTWEKLNCSHGSHPGKVKRRLWQQHTKKRNRAGTGRVNSCQTQNGKVQMAKMIRNGKSKPSTSFFPMFCKNTAQKTDTHRLSDDLKCNCTWATTVVQTSLKQSHIVIACRD